LRRKNNEPGFRVHLQSQCCGSGINIPDPEFYPSWIPDLGSRIKKHQQKKGVKIVAKLSKILGLGSEIQDPRSGIPKKHIPDPGSRGKKCTGSRILIRNIA
jgi:hypothetical protein